MSNSDAPDYGDAWAAVYDELHPGVPDDSHAVSLLAELAGSGGSALELGVGTGRFAIPLTQAGVHVCGLDAS